jgi:hypothetical protein
VPMLCAIPRMGSVHKAARPALNSSARPVVCRSLAQPLDVEWATHRQAAQDERATIRTRKIQQQEMDERKKRTCLLVVYHTVSLSHSEPCSKEKSHIFNLQNGSQPAQIDHYVDTFPRFQLTSSPDLVRDLELNEDSRLDHWDGEWTGSYHLHHVASTVAVEHLDQLPEMK